MDRPELMREEDFIAAFVAECESEGELSNEERTTAGLNAIDIHGEALVRAIEGRRPILADSFDMPPDGYERRGSLYVHVGEDPIPSPDPGRTEWESKILVFPYHYPLLIMPDGSEVGAESGTTRENFLHLNKDVIGRAWRRHARTRTPEELELRKSLPKILLATFDNFMSYGHPASAWNEYLEESLAARVTTILPDTLRRIVEIDAKKDSERRTGCMALYGRIIAKMDDGTFADLAEIGPYKYPVRSRNSALDETISENRKRNAHRGRDMETDFVLWSFRTLAERAKAENTPQAKYPDTGSRPLPQDHEKLETVRRMILDQMGTRKGNGTPIPKGHRRRLAEIDAILAGGTPEPGVLASMPVFGHPEATDIRPDLYANLIPLNVRSRDSVEWRIDKAQKALDEVAGRLANAELVLRGAITGDRKKAKQYADSMAHTEDTLIRDLLRDETLPELNRLWKALPEAESASPDKTGIVKSKGHVEFRFPEDGSEGYELYKDESGALYRAPVGSVIDVDTGRRIGRWEAPPHMAGTTSESAAEHQNPKQMSFDFMEESKAV
jgi:hypothetical protein